MQIERIRLLYDKSPLLGFACSDLDSLNEWRRKVRDKIRELIRFAQFTPLVPVSVVQTDHRYLDVFEYKFHGFADLEIRSVFLKPRGDGPHPFVLVCPGRFSDYRRTSGLLPAKYPNENISEQLALAGIAALTLDYGFSSNIDAAVLNGRDETNLFAIASLMLGYSPLALIIHDLLGGLLWAKQLGTIDNRKMGIFGRSLGGMFAVYLSLLFDEPHVVALSSFLGNFKSIFAENYMAGGAMTLPGIYKYADLPDLTAAISPNPLHIQHGNNDPFFPIQDAKKGTELVDRCYELCGCGEHFEFEITDSGHGTDLNYVLKFFNRYLSG